jgi:CheY-like chemotaxis protein
MVEQNLNQIVAVVDDDGSVCRALKRLLLSVGIHAETFSGGKEFLDTLSRAAPCWSACVVLDFQMPGIDGLEVQRRLAPSPSFSLPRTTTQPFGRRLSGQVPQAICKSPSLMTRLLWR